MRKLIKWHIDDDSVESSVKHDNSWKINQITSVKRYHSKLFLLSNIANKKAIELKSKNQSSLQLSVLQKHSRLDHPTCELSSQNSSLPRGFVLQPREVTV